MAGRSNPCNVACIKYVKSVSFFYELSANDIGIMKFGYNWKAGFWDVFGLSLGFKTQLL